MTKLIEYSSDDGSIVIESVSDGSPQLVAAETVLAHKKLEDTLAAINPLLSAIKRSIDAIERPKETSVELNIGFSATAGVFVASGEANASIKIALTWK